MSNEDIGYDLERDGLEGWMAFGEAMEEQRQVLLCKIL